MRPFAVAILTWISANIPMWVLGRHWNYDGLDDSLWGYLDSE
jgi:hypothetical protein